MIFSTPTTDVAFKKLFGSRTHTALTVSFLNSILEKKEGERIVSVTINDNANLPTVDGRKASFVDVSCTDQAGRHYIVEIQVNAQKDFLARAQHYAAFRLASQLTERSKYADMVPVIFVAVLEFNLFDEQDYITHLEIINRKTGKQEMFHLEFHFVELNKFVKNIDELSTMAEKWIYLLQRAAKLKEVPAQMQDSAELRDAFRVLEQHSWTKLELDAYHRELDAWRVEQSIRETAIEIATAKGMEIGTAKGMEIGTAKGIEIGMEKVRSDLIHKLFAAGFDAAKISEVIGLSVDEVMNVKKS